MAKKPDPLVFTQAELKMLNVAIVKMFRDVNYLNWLKIEDSGLTGDNKEMHDLHKKLKKLQGFGG